MDKVEDGNEDSKEKISFIDKIRKILKRTSKYVDNRGKIGYISYPPKIGFSEKQQERIVELEINDITTFGAEEKIALRQLRNLKKLTLGRCVQGISKDDEWIPEIEILQLSNDVKKIPEKVLDTIKSNEVVGEKFGISIGKNIDSIFIDELGRLNVCGKDMLLWVQKNSYNSRGNSLSGVNSKVDSAISYSILEKCSRLSNSNSIYVYRTDENYSVQVVIDNFPMSEQNAQKISSNALIGIFINNCQEVKLEDLEKYPNLAEVFIGKNVKRVRGNWDDEKRKWGEWIDIGKTSKYLQEYGYKLNILSEDMTTVINERNSVIAEECLEKQLEKDEKIIEERE